jgi:fructose-1,6-bisphosphatase I
MESPEPLVTLDRFILDRQELHPQARGRFTRLLNAIITASKIISAHANRAGLTGILGTAGRTNVQGETVQKLDLYAHEMLRKMMDYKLDVCLMASEEEKTVMDVSVVNPQGLYVVNYDPLDGSSNIGVNVSIGTIFSILRRRSKPGEEPTIHDCLQPGVNQEAAGYILYSSSTMLVYTSGHGVNGFTLDPTLGEFILSHPDIRIPRRAKYYSVNEGNYHSWDRNTQRYIDYLKTPGEAPRRPLSARYIGSLVADFHRNLLEGGIFLYPATRKHPSGKLRLLYEASPLAFVVEQAGGAATDGHRRIMEIEPTELHQRVPLIIGSAEDVEEAGQFIRGERTWPE